MKIHPECIPCFIKQTLDAAKMLDLDANLTRKALDEALVHVARIDWDRPPPLTGRDMHEIIARVSCLHDPYEKQKIAHTSDYLVKITHFACGITSLCQRHTALY